MGKVLIIGANSFIAKHVISKLELLGIDTLLTTRKELNIENEESIQIFAQGCKDSIDGVLFFQGINPSINAKEMTGEHFNIMLNVNLIGPTLLLKHINAKLNAGALILFMSSIAAKKGSYDPSYASSKSAIEGLTISLANEYTNLRFNTISLGLVKGSPVYEGMTEDFRDAHANRMNGGFINKEDVTSVIIELLRNKSINKAQINIDRGFKS